MVARLTILLCLCAILAPTSSTILEGILSIVEDIVEYADYDGTDSPTQDYDDENFDWLYSFLEESDECDPNPCLNNGVCEPKGSTFKCTCPAPYTGKKCQRVKNPCKKAKCGRGECVITVAAPYYECKCQEPYRAPTCRKAVACDPNPCLNGGTCEKGRTRSSFHCECPLNYTGKFCQVGPEDCYEGDGSSYEGFVSETYDGDECLHWNSHLILEKAADSFTEYQEDEKLGPHNYCRNPDGDVRPWCFIKHKGKLVWDYCKPRRCGASGTQSPTESPWDPSKPTPPATTDFAVCGKPQPNRFTPRIYGGKKSIPGAHPWQVSLQVGGLSLDDEFTHMCGGALIEPCWVLTAAHCIDPGFQIGRAVLGKADLAKDDWSVQNVEVERAIVHENYSQTEDALYNDIALLKLKDVNGRCTNETKFVKTACLPDGPFPDGTECTISGWGATPNADHSKKLLDAKVLLISQKRCTGDISYGSRLDDSMFCAGNMKGGVDSCQGDSGGPLVCERNGTHFVYGVVSWGDSCGLRNKPGIYTRVTEFMDWINSKIRA
ncbi:hypothetical protein AGOR_G00203770 [Albula goreensis]|uniref:trypsin n=1 Tax=Albula goreensis TaxID=1534307 RepID=A0A8T3CU06_9TELE|nr:hypothetical protein AGOR_G00203770 [Albula goreensis]